MKIETEFSVGDELWFMYENTATSSEVISITAIIYSPMNIHINYELELTYRKEYKVGEYFKYEDIHVEIPQHKIFRTKQDLLNSL